MKPQAYNIEELQQLKKGKRKVQGEQQLKTQSFPDTKRKRKQKNQNKRKSN